MKEARNAVEKSVGRSATWPVMLGTMLTMSVALMSQASAESGDAEKLLKAMSDYVASQNTISVAYDSDIEVITPHLQKIQFASSGQVQLSRPDKIRATRTGGYRDVEIVFDGKLVTTRMQSTSSRSMPKGPPIISLTCCAKDTASWPPAPTCCFRMPSR